MRMLLKVTIPHHKFNEEVRKGTIGTTVGKILEELKPEAVYFANPNGKRGAVMVINIEKSSDIPRFAEPWFLTFEADCTFEPMMGPDDLQQAGLDEIGKMWS